MFATTTTDNNSLIIVLDRAHNGDLKSFYKALINKHNISRIPSTWSPGDNMIDGHFYGIQSMLPWRVLSAADRMIQVFKVSSALKKVHENGLLHRDLKPENVMVDEHGQVKLADFGGTKDQASIDTGNKQTGLYTWGWADMNARAG